MLTKPQAQTLRELPHFRVVRRLTSGELVLKGAAGKYVLDQAGNVSSLRRRRQLT